MKKDLILFVAGMLATALLYYLIFKPKDKELPTIFDQQEQVENQKKAEKKIERSKKKETESKQRIQRNRENNDKIFNDGLTDTEYDSVIRAIEADSRKADSLRNAAGL